MSLIICNPGRGNAWDDPKVTFAFKMATTARSGVGMRRVLVVSWPSQVGPKFDAGSGREAPGLQGVLSAGS
jgi:hypothetical protein